MKQNQSDFYQEVMKSTSFDSQWDIRPNGDYFYCRYGNIPGTVSFERFSFLETIPVVVIGYIDLSDGDEFLRLSKLLITQVLSSVLNNGPIMICTSHAPFIEIITSFERGILLTEAEFGYLTFEEEDTTIVGGCKFDFPSDLFDNLKLVQEDYLSLPFTTKSVDSSDLFIANKQRIFISDDSFRLSVRYESGIKLKLNCSRPSYQKICDSLSNSSVYELIEHWYLQTKLMWLVKEKVYFISVDILVNNIFGRSDPNKSTNIFETSLSNGLSFYEIDVVCSLINNNKTISKKDLLGQYTLQTRDSKYTIEIIEENIFISKNA